MRAFAVVVALSLLLAGCSEPAPEASSPAEVARRLYGPNLVAAAPSLQIAVRGVEPTGTEPFELLDAMVTSEPGQVVYTLGCGTPNGPDRVENEYRWDVAERTVTWTRTRSNGPAYSQKTVAVASDVNTDALSAVASGERSAPVFEAVGASR